MGIFPNTDEAVMSNPRLDTICRVMITAGQLLSQIGTKLIQSRNELLTDALEGHVNRLEEALQASYQAGRRDERDGVPDIYADERQGDEGQGDGMVWTVNEDELRAP